MVSGVAHPPTCRTGLRHCRFRLPARIRRTEYDADRLRSQHPAHTAATARRGQPRRGGGALVRRHSCWCRDASHSPTARSTEALLHGVLGIVCLCSSIGREVKVLTNERRLLTLAINDPLPGRPWPPRNKHFREPDTRRSWWVRQRGVCGPRAWRCLRESSCRNAGRRGNSK